MDENPIEFPVKVVRDTNEGAPFSFKGLYVTDPKAKILTITRNPRCTPLHVSTVDRALWTKGYADYTLDGLEREVQIETKHSVNDLFASFGKRRKNFEREIANLNRCVKYSLVLVTATWNQMIQGVEHSQMSPKSVRNSIASWDMKYPFVSWRIVPARELAEVICLQTLEFAYRRFNATKNKDAT